MKKAKYVFQSRAISGGLLHLFRVWGELDQEMRNEEYHTWCTVFLLHFLQLGGRGFRLNLWYCTQFQVVRNRIRDMIFLNKLDHCHRHQTFTSPETSLTEISLKYTSNYYYQSGTSKSHPRYPYTMRSNCQSQECEIIRKLTGVDPPFCPQGQVVVIVPPFPSETVYLQSWLFPPTLQV